MTLNDHNTPNQVETTVEHQWENFISVDKATIKNVAGKSYKIHCIKKLIW
jgi:hypothetical protein